MRPNPRNSHDHPDPPEPTSWGRAIAVSSATVVLLVLAFFYVPQWILTLPAGMTRGVRVWLATGWTAFAFAAACYAAWWYTGPSTAAPATDAPAGGAP